MKSINFLIINPPYESSNLITALRLMSSAIEKKINVKVFAYEGSTAITLAGQKGHPNTIHGTSLEEEKHPLSSEIYQGLKQRAQELGVEFHWTNCGLCADERGVGNWVEGPVRGGPPNFVKTMGEADKTLVIASY